ncbi:Major facilitator superfamily permease [Candidatus Defluviicoccus seviourii]|uniref:Major facilitator superfamily permease n=1 Tax=Candidatus Defluviicoccus seviourii TaxID=2565273 RepID=A0A564WAG8_9PROT|nr:Major facilitator superfamily permease [Candidatus Defluviicoccus seviourii]
MAALKRLHYGWVVVVAGMLTVFASIGFGRFALGMLLPSMGVSLNLTYAEMGLISTGNLVGYLVAVYGVRFLVRRIGARWTVTGGLVLVGASMIVVGRAIGFADSLVLYTLTGLGSGIANVPVMGLVSLWFARQQRGKAAGLMVIGNGLAIAAAGLLVPAVSAALGAEGWRASWLILALAVLAVALVCGLILRNHPAELNLVPVGTAPAAATHGTGKSAVDQHAPLDRRKTRLLLAHLGTIYALFGGSYVIYATFIVTSLVADHGYTEMTAGTFWVWIGALSVFSGPVFGSLSDRIGRRAGLAVVFSFQATSYALAAAAGSPAALWLSVVLFGFVAWSTPSIMAAAVGDYMGAAHAADAFGTVTVIFGIGQIIGPALAGVAADHFGGFAASFWLASVLAMAALCLALLLRPPLAATPAAC